MHARSGWPRSSATVRRPLRTTRHAKRRPAEWKASRHFVAQNRWGDPPFRGSNSVSHQEADQAILRQHGLSKADAGAIVDKDDRAALDTFLSGRSDDIDIDSLEDLAHVLGLTVGQLMGDARSTSIH